MGAVEVGDAQEGHTYYSIPSLGYTQVMKTVKSIAIETEHRGIALIFSTDGEPVAVRMTKFEARQLALRLMRMLGTKRGEGED